MSTTVLQRENNQYYLNKSKKTLLKVGLFYFVLLSLSCQSSPALSTSEGLIQNPRDSSIDTKYKLNKMSMNRVQAESSSVEFYQKVLRSSLYSHCDYYPSDSRYAQILSKQCGSFVALFKTYDRFIREPDSAYLGMRMTVTEYGVQFVHLPENCDVF